MFRNAIAQIGTDRGQERGGRAKAKDVLVYVLTAGIGYSSVRSSESPQLKAEGAIYHARRLEEWESMTKQLSYYGSWESRQGERDGGGGGTLI